MEKKEIKKWLPLIVSSIIIYWGINNLNIIGSFINKIMQIIFPFILGGALAFILNIPMSFFERKLSKIKYGKKQLFKNKKMLRTISLVLAVIVIAIILYIIVNLVVPELLDVVELLIGNIPYYAEEISKFIENNTEHLKDLDNLMTNINFDKDSIKNELMGIVSGLLTSSISLVIGIVGVVVNLFI